MSKSPKFKRKHKKHFLCIGIGGILLTTAGISLSYGRYFVNHKLSPLIEQELTTLLERPVEIGNVESFSPLGGVTFSQSTIPPTLSDSNHAEIAKIKVNFNPWMVILRGQLNLKVNLIKPNIYVEQQINRAWIPSELNIDSQDSANPKINLQGLDLTDAQVTLVSRTQQGILKTPVDIFLDSARLSLHPREKLLEFTTEGKLNQGGTLKLSGSMNIPTQDLNVLVQGNQLDAKQVSDLLLLPLSLEQGTIDSNLEVKIRPKQPPQLKGIAKLQDVNALLDHLPYHFYTTNGELQFIDYQIQLNLQSKLDLIPLKAHGIIDRQQGFALQAQTLPTPITEAIESLQIIKPPVEIAGNVISQISITGALSRPQLQIDVFNDQSLTIAETEFTSFSSRLQLVDNLLTIENLEAIPSLGGKLWGNGYLKLGDRQLSLNLRGSDVIVPNLKIINLETEFFGSWENLSDISGLGEVKLALGNGFIALDNIQYNNLNWQTNVITENLTLADLGVTNSQLAPAELQTNLVVSGKLNKIALDTINANGNISLKLGDKSVSTNNLSLNNGNWNANLEATNFSNNNINTQINLNGTINNNSSDIIAQAQGKVILDSNNYISLENLSLENNQLSLRILSENLDLSLFYLEGYLTGETDIQADLDNLSLENLRVNSKLNFLDAITFIDGALSTDLTWDGKLLNINQVTGTNINGKGWIEISKDGKIQDIELNLQQANLNLAYLFKDLSITGLLFFQGKLQRINNQFQIDGDLAVNHLQIPGLDFAENLPGKIITDTQGNINLDIQSEKDLIQLSIDNNYRPNNFFLKQSKWQLIGDRRQNDLSINLVNFPLETLKLFRSFPISYQVISGTTSGDVTLNLNSFNLVSNLTINQPALGKVKAEQLTMNLSYWEGLLNVNDLQIEQGKTNYSGEIALNLREKTPKIQGQLSINDGQIQDILETLKFLQLSDLGLGIKPEVYGDATTIGGEDKQITVGLPEQTILEQLHLISRLNYFLNLKEENEETNLQLPDISQLTGIVNGKLSLNGYLDSRIEADFTIEGKNWQWDTYNLDQLLIQGNFYQKSLSLNNINLTRGQTSVNFVGYFGERGQKGELKIKKLPLNVIETLVKSPVKFNLDGTLNGTIYVDGRRENPEARGNFRLEEVVINNIPVYDSQGKFNYQNAYLNVSLSSLLQENTKPIQLQGSFPYQLPFATISPNSDQLKVSLNIENEGLRIIDILTEQGISWQEGKGSINIDISGNFDQKQGEFFNVKTLGEINLEAGNIVTAFLPKRPFKNISGQILFNFNQVEIPELTGDFNGGNFSVTGKLPINQANDGESLDINLDNLNLEIDELYQGIVNGNVQILGSIFEPLLTGNLHLSQGKITLPETNITKFNQENYISKISIDGLKLNLGEAIQIVREPVLNVVASGSLNLFGNLTNLNPEGTIKLKQGGVNLFTTYLRLAKDNDNRARFLPNQGLDPYLEVRLLGSVTEANVNNLVRDPLSSEVSDAPVYSVGSVETIRVEANVRGFASQLNRNLELSSSPPRSQQEIIALLGGGLVNTLDTGDATLGLANLASSAIFNSFQQELANNIGVSEFRIFPAPIIESEERTDNFELAAEIGFDATRKFSFSVLKILTNTQPPQFGIRYRLNDHLLLRGSTDFSEDSRGVLEYQLRF